MAERLKVALVQMNSVSDRAANLDAAEALMEQAVAEGSPDLIVLPEHFDWAGGRKEQKIAAADAMPGGEAYSRMQAFARKHGVFVHAGSMLETIPGESRIHNTTVVFDRQGTEIARYRKIHMFDIVAPDGATYKESESVKPGSGTVTYDLEGFRIGCAICYDLRFPYLFQALTDAGAEVIVLPASFTLQTGKDHWEVLCRARAIENDAYFVACGQWGTFTHGDGSTRHTYGHSLVTDPWGHVVAKASDGVGVLHAEIRRAEIDRVRGLIPVIDHRVEMAA